jgi:hypothetical protein
MAQDKLDDFMKLMEAVHKASDRALLEFLALNLYVLLVKPNTISGNADKSVDLLALLDERGRDLFGSEKSQQK